MNRRAEVVTLTIISIAVLAGVILAFSQPNIAGAQVILQSTPEPTETPAGSLTETPSETPQDTPDETLQETPTATVTGTPQETPTPSITSTVTPTPHKVKLGKIIWGQLGNAQSIQTIEVDENAVETLISSAAPPVEFTFACNSDEDCPSDDPPQVCAIPGPPVEGGCCVDCRFSGEACNSDEQCCPGLACFDGECEACHDKGESCETDEQCCGNLECTDGTCKKNGANFLCRWRCLGPNNEEVPPKGFEFLGDAELSINICHSCKALENNAGLANGVTNQCLNMLQQQKGPFECEFEDFTLDAFTKCEKAECNE